MNEQIRRDANGSIDLSHYLDQGRAARSQSAHRQIGLFRRALTAWGATAKAVTTGGSTMPLGKAARS